MYKIQYLVLLSLFASPAIAKKLSYEEARQTVSTGQARIRQLKSQLKACDAEVHRLKTMLEKASGNDEYRQDIEKFNQQRRRKIDERNQLVTQLTSAQQEFANGLGRVGRKYAIVSNGNGGYHVTRPAKQPAT